MISKRNRKTTKTGGQPVMTGIRRNSNKVCMLSNDAKMRGLMITLKKILITFVQTKVKKLVPLALKYGIWLAFSGIDSVNLHFTNKSIHIGFIELVLIPNISNGIETNFDKALEEVSKNLLKEINDVIRGLGNLDSAEYTKDILDQCSFETTESGLFFSITNVDKDKNTIDFIYLSEKTSKTEKQPFIEIRCLKHVKSTPMDRYGIRYMSLNHINRDVNTGMGTYGSEDWEYRKSNLKHSLTRSDLTLSFTATESMMRECFPAVAFKKIGSKEAVKKLIKNNISIAPQIYEQELRELHNRLINELENANSENIIEETVFLEVLISRATKLGIIPDDEELHEVLINDYNLTILSELKSEFLNK